MRIILRPIGVVRIRASDEEVRRALHGVDGVIEVYDRYVEGLKGLENYSHLVIITYLHRVKPGEFRLRVKPRGLVKRGFRLEELPELGVFATCSPQRPNPLGVTVVRLIRRDGRFLYVRGLDVFDGTPVLDIKPYNRGMYVSDFKSLKDILG